MADQSNEQTVFTVVGCGSKKVDESELDWDGKLRAKNLYTSPYMRAKISVAEHSNLWGIASAEYGLLHPNDRVELYERDLREQSEAYVSGFSKHVVRNIPERVTDLVLLAGKAYRNPIQDRVDQDTRTHSPFDGKGLFSQQSWLGDASTKLDGGRDYLSVIKETAEQ